MKSLTLSALALLFIATTAVAQDTSYRASDNTLFILPTGDVVPKGTHQLNSFQLFFVGYNYGVTDRLQVGAFAFFPFSVSIFRESFSVSAKYNFYRSNRFSLSGMGVIFPANGVTLAVASGTYAINKTRLHAGFGTGFIVDDPNDAAPLIAILGVDHNLSDRVSLMSEYSSLASSFIDDASGIFSVGARFHFENGNIDFGGMRPSGTGGDFLAFPFIRGTIEFN